MCGASKGSLHAQPLGPVVLALGLTAQQNLATLVSRYPPSVDSFQLWLPFHPLTGPNFCL